MNKSVLALALVAALAACSSKDETAQNAEQSAMPAEQTAMVAEPDTMTTEQAAAPVEKPVLTAAEQVEGLNQMCADNAAAMQQRQQAEPLYTRLGGETRIREFATTLLKTHQSNEEMKRFFGNVPEHPFVDNVTAFISVNSGGGGEYTGRSMKEVHQGFGITYDDFLAAGADIQKVMTDFGYGENEQQEVLCFLASNLPQVIASQ